MVCFSQIGFLGLFLVEMSFVLFLAERFHTETAEEQRLRYIFSRSVSGAAFLRVGVSRRVVFVLFLAEGFLAERFLAENTEEQRRRYIF